MGFATHPDYPRMLLSMETFLSLPDTTIKIPRFVCRLCNKNHHNNDDSKKYCKRQRQSRSSHPPSHDTCRRFRTLHACWRGDTAALSKRHARPGGSHGKRPSAILATSSPIRANAADPLFVARQISFFLSRSPMKRVGGRRGARRPGFWRVHFAPDVGVGGPGDGRG